MQLDALELEVERFEVVIFFWTSSHKGVVVNEMADIFAGRALELEHVQVERQGCGSHASLTLGARRTGREAAMLAVRRWVLAQLREASIESVWLERGDWQDVDKGSARMEHVTRAFLSKISGVRQ